MPEAKIIRVARTPSTVATRLGKFDRIVVYTIDNATIHSIVLPDEEATDSKIEEMIRKATQESARLVGRTYKI